MALLAPPDHQPMTTDWKTTAPCRGKTELFFGRSSRLKISRHMCGVCRLADVCLWDCMANEEGQVAMRSGVWAGTTPDQRQAIHEVLGYPGPSEYERRRDEAVAALAPRSNV